MTRPERWRIIGARADAWLAAVHVLGWADIEGDVSSDTAWRASPGPILTRTDIVTPRVDGGLTVAIGRSRLGSCDDAGVVVGVGIPAVQIEWFPDCGCDACDWGSAPELERLDELLAAVITGQFRFLVDGRHSITVGLDGARAWSGSTHLSSVAVDTILSAPETPVGWREWRGAPWGTPRNPVQRTPR